MTSSAVADERTHICVSLFADKYYLDNYQRYKRKRRKSADKSEFFADNGEYHIAVVDGD